MRPARTRWPRPKAPPPPAAVVRPSSSCPPPRSDYSHGLPARIRFFPFMLDASRTDLVAGVAGAGTMGRGIAQVLAQCGARTLLFDAQPGAAQKAKESIAQSLAKLVEKGRTSGAEAEKI